MAFTHGLYGASGESKPSPTPLDHELDSFALAARHMMRWNVPGPSFFEGALLGNGDVGVCAVVRPDAVGLHIGKNDCWDIRVSDDPGNAVLPFEELRQLWKLASEEAIRQNSPDMLFIESSTNVFRQYTERTGISYSKSWPRPWPCGTIWINWDPRWVRVKDYSLNPANGMFQMNAEVVPFDSPAHDVRLSCFVDWESGLVSVTTNQVLPLETIYYIPATDNDNGADHLGLPRPEIVVKTNDDEASFACFQRFPAIGPTQSQPVPPPSEKDRNFSLKGRIAGKWSVEHASAAADVVFRPSSMQQLRLDVLVATPRDILLQKKEESGESVSGHSRNTVSIPQDIVYSESELATALYVDRRIGYLAAQSVQELQESSEGHWREHWLRSAIELEDKQLEKVWYLNQYFLACCLRPQKTAPGLFANWHTRDIGMAWHSDYHMDYNCQQLYWGVFSSNHADMHLPYVELCENLMPIAETFAHDNYKLPGAFFPLSSYPVPNQQVAYPVPPWAYQVSMTPWAVQSLWWHYLYTQDEEYLRRVYPMMRAATQFLAAFVRKGRDGRYHIAPTVSSENWGFTVNERLNKDCILDLALTKFLFRAMLSASEILKVDDDHAVRWRDIYEHIAAYPKVDGPHGEVWLDVVNAPAEHVYNIPITLAPVFPGEDVGIVTTGPAKDIAVRTAKTIRLEGGNDLVFQPLIRARLGMLDFDWFKEQVNYCTLPDGIANDRVRQSGGRYPEAGDFDFMMRMGVWCENFALPAVLNECMMQSYSGTIRLFPNAEGLGPARFERLRAVGAFLVSATYDGNRITRVSLHSEMGKRVHLERPWPGASIRVTRTRDSATVPAERSGTVFSFSTSAAETYEVAPA